MFNEFSVNNIIKSIFPKNKVSVELTNYSTFIFFTNLTATFVNFLYTVFFSRLIGPANFGVLILSMSSIDFVMVFLSFNTYEAVIKYVLVYIDSDESKAKTIIWVGYLFDFTLAITIFLIVFLLRGFIAKNIFHNIVMKDLICIYSFSLLVEWANGVSIGVAQIFKKYHFIGLFSIFSAIIRLIIPILLISFGLKGIVAGHVIASLIVTLISVIFSLKLIKKNFKISKIGNIGKCFKEMSSFIFQNFFALTFKSLHRYIDVLILGYYKPPAEVSYYKIALSVGGILGFVSSPVSQVVYPYLIKMQKESKERISLFVKKLTLILIGITIPSALILTYLGKYIILFFYSNKYIYSIKILPLIIFPMGVTGIFSWIKPMILSIGKPEILIKVNFLMAVIMVATSLLLVPFYGFVGSAISYFISYILGYILLLIILKVKLKS